MCPGWVRTEMGGAEAERSPAEGAETAVRLATLDDGGPTGGFFRDRKMIAWQGASPARNRKGVDRRLPLFRRPRSGGEDGP